MEEIRCPYCAELILAEAKKCKHCHEWLKPRPETPTGETPSGAAVSSDTTVSAGADSDDLLGPEQQERMDDDTSEHPISRRSRAGRSRRRTGVIASSLVVVAAFILVAGNFHIANTREGLKVYKKDGFSFADTFVDVTELSVVDLPHHHSLASAMSDAGDTRLLPGGRVVEAARIAGEAVEETVEQAVEGGRQLLQATGQALREGVANLRQSSQSPREDESTTGTPSKRAMADCVHRRDADERSCRVEYYPEYDLLFFRDTVELIKASVPRDQLVKRAVTILGHLMQHEYTSAMAMMVQGADPSLIAEGMSWYEGKIGRLLCFDPVSIEPSWTTHRVDPVEDRVFSEQRPWVVRLVSRWEKADSLLVTVWPSMDGRIYDVDLDEPGYPSVDLSSLPHNARGSSPFSCNAQAIPPN